MKFFLDIVNQMADEAGQIIRQYYRGNIGLQEKADASPVTIADQLVEQKLREMILQHFPNHGILGEEKGSLNLDAEYVWVLDPIDGTKSFVMGKPQFGTLIALLHHGKPILGIIDQPILNERWVGVDNTSTLNSQPIHVRQNLPLNDAILYSSSLFKYSKTDYQKMMTLRSDVKWDFYTGDCYAFGLLALGLVDIVIETGLQPYDYCAMVPIIRNAGGFISDWNGNDLGMHSNGNVIATGDEKIYHELLKRFST